MFQTFDYFPFCYHSSLSAWNISNDCTAQIIVLRFPSYKFVFRSLWERLPQKPQIDSLFIKQKSCMRLCELHNMINIIMVKCILTQKQHYFASNSHRTVMHKIKDFQSTIETIPAETGWKCSNHNTSLDWQGTYNLVRHYHRRLIFNKGS